MRKQFLNLQKYEALILAEAKVDAENAKKKVPRRIPNVRDPYGLRLFINRWFAGITESIQALYKTDGDDTEDKTKLEAKFVSRTELSLVNDPINRKKLLEDKTLSFSSKGFYGTPLPLIPDIRKSEVSEGVVGQLLEALGVSKKFESIVTLSKGPNRRLNRYLVYQYKRLIKSIDGTLVEGNSSKSAHVIWKYNIYKITCPEKKTDLEKMELLGLKKKLKWVTIREHLQKEKVIDLDLELNNLKRVLKRKAKLFWDIAYQLIRGSISFRIAVLQKILGKKGRWFHRDIDIEELFAIFKGYQIISDRFDSKMQMKRTWISTEQKNGSFKWRPLGIASYPWRIFTRGINNLLETFLANSWPENQHGYKTGRGVHTAWNQILRTIINAKYIIEFDFAGFFNTVRMEAIGKTLDRFLVPKPMIAYLINISSMDIQNIGSKTKDRLLKTQDPTKLGWASAWRKYEYIHNFRKGFRSTGLPQGFALSPVLSVLTLIALEELKKKDISHILYADDGLFYSDNDADFLEEAQQILDKHGIGAFFNIDKCKVIKDNNIWLGKLKFVGLVYDPKEDMLSASTRNGAKLKLRINAIAYFSKDEIPDKIVDVVLDQNHNDWNDSNNKLFDIYEDIYLNKSFKSIVNQDYFDNIEKQAVQIMKQRFLKYSVSDISLLQKDSVIPIELSDFLFPIRLLLNISKTSYFELIEIYERWMDSPFPRDIFDKEVYKSKFWMDKDLSGREFETAFNNRVKEKSINSEKDWWQTSYIENMGTDKNVEKILENLRWFHQLDEVPDSISDKFKNGELELGRWLDLELKDLDIDTLPKNVVDSMKLKGGKMGFSQVNWRNLYMDPIFATFIARLFQDSFRSGITKQSFKLTTDKTLLTLVKALDTYVGRNKWVTLLEGERFNIFNSSTICSNLLIQLASTWLPHVRSKRAAKVPIHIRTYKPVINRIINRRSNAWRSDYEVMYTDYQLKPYKVALTKKHERTKLHLISKYKYINSLPIEAISRSPISLHEILTEEYKRTSRAFLLYPYKGVRWDTLSPKNKLRN
jgi:hypothetical protein